MMPSQRRKDPVSARRRIRDDGDDDVSVNNEHPEDSLSEDSIPSDAEDADADDSDLSDDEVKGATGGDIRTVKSNGSAKHAPGSSPGTETKAPLKRSSSEPLTFETTKDTEAMLNGLSISQDDSKVDAIEFDDSKNLAPEQASEGFSKNRSETLGDRRRREHEEYKQKRASDPAFIPTRGAFFMHDQRHGGPGGIFRGAGRGRGRGRGGPVAPFSPAVSASFSNEPSNSPWSHDLHDTLLEPVAKGNAPANAPSGPSNTSTGALRSPTTPIVRSFSITKVIGKIQMRVRLPGMKEPIAYSDVSVKLYTKLPNHRPPLRQDKPVRVSLPSHPVRYIFPHMDRSFVFIPRAMRPNQQGFGRGRGRGVASYGGFSSRRTSMYGGSVYSPSVAMSRRSSIAREGMASPAGSYMSARPVVRLPPGSQHHHTGSGTPYHPSTLSASGTPAFGVPQGPAVMGHHAAYRENWGSNLQMHQPRPQKTISVTGIEYPATTYQAPIPSEQQPFHHQIPPQMNGAQDGNIYSHSRQASYQIAPLSSGTPLSNIPERAIHAQPFQPYQTNFNQYGAQPAYYYAGGNHAAGQFTPGAVIAPMFVPSPQQGGYMLPTIAAAAPPDQQANTGSAPAPGFVAHEQNGMVYYIDPNQMSTPMYGQAEGYAADYVAPAAADGGYYYSQVPPTMYYPSQ